MKERVLRRSLNEKEKVIYAPFSGVGGIVYDHDAVYIDLGGSHSHKRPQLEEGEGLPEVISPFVGEMRELKATLNEKMESSALKLFSASNLITPAEMDEDDEGNGQDEDLSDEGSDFGEEEEQTSTSTTQKSVKLVQSCDGRMRRKVMFDDEDDVTHQMQTELEKLKKQEKKGTVQTSRSKPSKEKDSTEILEEAEEAVSKDSGDDEDELQVEEPNSRKQVTLRKIAEPAKEEVNVMNLAFKLKARLSKKEESSSTAVEEKVNETSIPDSDIEDEGNSSSDEDDKDEEDVESGVEDSESNEDEQGEDMDITNHEFGEDPESIKIMKQKRYADAEAGFYSRFYKRSLQKMIYEDTTEFMNVGPKADFDLANCTVQEVQGKAEMEKVDDERIKNLFVGGDYADAAKGLLQADDEDVEDAFGDFEELDKDENEVEEGKDEEMLESLDPQVAEDRKAKKRDDMKKKLKEKFDMDYDGGGDEGEKSFYKDWKSQVEEQTKVTFNSRVEPYSFSLSCDLIWSVGCFVPPNR